MGGKRPEPLGAVLQRCRIAAGLSQEELAERAGLSVRGIGDLERGQRRAPRLRTIQLLADALGLDDAGRKALSIAARPELVGASPLQAARILVPMTGDPLPLPPGARIPVPPTRLIGRDQDIEEVVALLRADYPRLVTLTGPGGVGKTQLGIVAARQAANEFVDGAVFVELAPVRESHMVVPQIARAVGLRDTGTASGVEDLLGLLDDRQLLLVLDNCEHLLPAMPIVASLLAASSGITVLATSRERLHLRGEREFPVEPLSLPEAGSTTGPPALLAQMLDSAAIQLFVERAQEAKPGFSRTEQDWVTIAAICKRLDGLPLAIELVAARIRYLAAAALLARLERHLSLHEDGPRDLPDRQRTLDATIAWSHDLLSPTEQVLFRRLSVFVGGFDTAAATAVAADVAPDTSGRDGAVPRFPAAAVFAGLTSLMDKNLLRQSIDGNGEARFAMLETIREHAAGRLAASGEEDSVRRAHAAYVLALSERATPELGGPEQRRWLDRLDVEGDNLRAALAWAASGRDVEMGLLLARCLVRFWHIRGYAAEGRGWLERLLTAAGGIALDARAWPTYNAGLLAWAQGDLCAAERWFTKSLAMFRELCDKKGVATALGMLGAVAEHEGNLDLAVVFNEQSLNLYRELDNAAGTATLLDALGNIAVEQGDHGRAVRLFDEALALYREIEDTSGVARVLSNIGAAALARGDIVTAERTNRESLSLHLQVGYREGVAYALENLARVAVARQEPARAARWFGAAEALREAIGTPLPPPAQDGYQRDVTAARRQTRETAFAQAWAAGRALPLEQVCAEALRLEG